MIVPNNGHFPSRVSTPLEMVHRFGAAAGKVLKVFPWGEGSIWGFRWLQKLTFGADFLLEDGADVDGLRHSLERGGVVAAEEAAVVLLRETSAVEGPRVVAEALRRNGGWPHAHIFHLQGATHYTVDTYYADKLTTC